MKSSIFEIPIIPQSLNIDNLRTTSANSINFHTIRKAVECSLENFLLKAMFSPTIFEILLSEGKSIISPAQRDTGSKRVNVSVKNQSNIGNLLKFLERWLTYKLRRFWIVFKYFSFCLALTVPEKLKNSFFEIPIIPESSNMNSLRTTSTKSTNLHTITKLVEYSLENFVVKTMFTLTVFEILLSEGRSVLSPAQRGTKSKRVELKWVIHWFFWLDKKIKKLLLMNVFNIPWKHCTAKRLHN